MLWLENKYVWIHCTWSFFRINRSLLYNVSVNVDIYEYIYIHIYLYIYIFLYIYTYISLCIYHFPQLAPRSKDLSSSPLSLHHRSVLQGLPHLPLLSSGQRLDQENPLSGSCFKVEVPYIWLICILRVEIRFCNTSLCNLIK